MSNNKKRWLCTIAVAIILCMGSVLYWFANPSFHAETFSVNPSAQNHLRGFPTDSPLVAGLEYIQWNYPESDHIQERHVYTAKQKALGNSSHEVTIIYGARDDSFNRIFHRFIIIRKIGVWEVQSVEKCWTGRGLNGWSTDAPS